MSALFGALVLAVFWRSADKGPASMLLRFHDGVRRQDANAIDNTVVTGPGHRSIEVLIRQTSIAFGRRAKVEIAGIDIQKSEARAAVIYKIENETPIATVWVLDREVKGWKVNAYKTVSLMEQLIERSGERT